MKTHIHAIILVWLIAFWTGFAQAETNLILRNKPVQCALPIDVVNEYILPHELDVMYIAVANIVTQFQQSELAAISFWMNAETGKFLMLEGNKEEVCVISLGDRMDFNVANDHILGLYLQDAY
jgi:hypothetical protein